MKTVLDKEDRICFDTRGQLHGRWSGLNLRK
jgi:hypothetical protein